MPSEGQKKGVSYIAANGSRMPNRGEKRVHFSTPGAKGGTSSITFQVTDVMKPLASVHWIVEKGNRVVFEEVSYIENLKTRKKIPIELVNGTYCVDVLYCPTAR